jgi:hypothetical protein
MLDEKALFMINSCCIWKNLKILPLLSFEGKNVPENFESQKPCRTRDIIYS